MSPPLDFDAVSRLVVDVARTELLPRFARVAELQVFSKDSAENPGDFCTEADLAAERRLREGLMALLPEAVFLGEEEASTDPTRLSLLAGDQPVWIADPLDGTRNFAAGLPTWGVMVALVEGGHTRGAWIHLPLEPATFVAEAGAGAWLDGRRIGEGAAPTGAFGGTTYTRFMPEAEAARFSPWPPAGVEERPGAGAAAVEYAALVRGFKDFVVYHRLLPWDHAPGALVMQEAGGAVRHPDGSPYRPGDGQPQILATRPGLTWEDVAARVLPFR